MYWSEFCEIADAWIIISATVKYWLRETTYWETDCCQWLVDDPSTYLIHFYTFLLALIHQTLGYINP